MSSTWQLTSKEMITTATTSTVAMVKAITAQQMALQSSICFNMLPIHLMMNRLPTYLNLNFYMCRDSSHAMLIISRKFKTLA